MLVPEAAVHINDFPAGFEDQVGLSGQRCRVKRIPEAHGMNDSAHTHFRRGIFALDRPHAQPSLNGSQIIRQLPSLLVCILKLCAFGRSIPLGCKLRENKLTVCQPHEQGSVLLHDAVGNVLAKALPAVVLGPLRELL